MSRLENAKHAVRPALKARLMLAGPAGAGKTFTALEIATTLGHSVLVIDTEKESALTYASEFEFEHLPWHEPYDPRELGTTLVEAAAAYDVLVVDSFSHFWTGTGGTLDIADGRFGGWKTARPAQGDAVTGILTAPAHVIICVRSKIEYTAEEVEQNGRRKQVVKKLGMAPQQDATLEYELNLSVEIDIDHRLSVSKSRSTAVAVGRTFAPGHARDLAKAYGEWLSSGEPFADLDVRARIDTARRELSDEQKRTLWQLWKDQGLPASVDLLTESQAKAAESLLAALTEPTQEVLA
jgi:KaiC/GvpD/RAD55 family RecA-like ATPase